jgi:guanylate kinase
MELEERIKQKVAKYRPSAQVVGLLNDAPILLLVAIAGGGKDTVKHQLLGTGSYHHIISHTTRPPRLNDGTLEQEGVEYHFIDFATAERMLDAGEYIEADVYAQNVYGTSISEIKLARQEGKISVTDMTIDGAAHYLSLAPGVKAVFLLPPSYDVWMKRLLKRYEGKPRKHDLYLRMQTAVQEIEQALKSDKYYIVVNDKLDETVDLVDRIGHGEVVEPHYYKAMAIAEEMVSRIKSELAKLS